jgi:hypothetical protein
MSNAGGFKSLNRYYDMLAGNTTWNPWEPDGAYDSLATVTVPSGGLASVTFAAIPNTYKHLQVRVFARSNRSSFTQDVLQSRYNSDTAANYTYHALEGTGTSAIAGAGVSTSNPWTMFTSGATATASVFSAGIIDILDYTNTTKNKTVRTLYGLDQNTSDGRLGLSSTLWNNTSAINRIDISPIFGTAITEFSQISLYGVK